MDRRELLGLGLLAGLALCVVSSARAHSDARPAGELILLLILLAAWSAGRAAARSDALRTILPLSVSAGIVAVLVVSPGAVTGAPDAPPLGYANANGALTVISTAAAATTALIASDRSVRRLAWWLALLGPVLAQGTGSRAALALALLVLGAGWALSVRSDRATAAYVSACAFAAVALVGTVTSAVMYAAPSRGGLYVEFAAAVVDEARLALWSDALQTAAAHPALGVGPGSFWTSSATALSDDDLLWAHSLVLQQSAELGLPGAALTVALTSWLLAQLRPATRTPGPHAAAAALTALLAGGVLAHAAIDYIAHFALVPGLLVFLVALAAGTKQQDWDGERDGHAWAPSLFPSPTIRA